MADVSGFSVWSSTPGNNNPQGGTSIGTGLDDNLREIQAQVAKWRDGQSYGVLTVTSVSGTNTIVGSTSPVGLAATGQKFLMTPAATNTGAVTLNLSSSGANALLAGNTALVGGELHANIPIFFEWDGTNYQLLGPTFKQPTITVLASGSGTYTTPTGATRVNVRMVGGGGGGGGSGTSPGAGSGGGNTTFGSLTASGGGGGNQSDQAAGASASGGDVNIPGGRGGPWAQPAAAGARGGDGCSSALGGGGPGGNPGSGQTTGKAGSTNSGAGGGGGGTNSAVASGGGGGAGAYVEKLLTNPSATYAYAVGGAGAGGSAGTSGDSGGSGAAGVIIVNEYYD